MPEKAYIDEIYKDFTLTANTEYKLMVVAQGATGGFVTSNTTFTTGS